MKKKNSPVHFNPHGLFINELPLNRLYGVGIVIDVRKYISHPNDTITMSELMDWGRSKGVEIPKGSIVILYTGWANYWGLYTSWDQYWSIARGWPGLSPDVAKYLVSKGIKGIALDVLSVDPPPQAVDFPAHKVIVSANIWIGENFNLAILPKKDTTAYIFSLPAMIVKEGSGAPARPILIYNFDLESLLNTYKALKYVVADVNEGSSTTSSNLKQLPSLSLLMLSSILMLVTIVLINYRFRSYKNY
ncbi:MAG: cyclase family protein [Sulfolobales archaeon]